MMVLTRASSKRPKSEDDTSSVAVTPTASTSQNIITVHPDDGDDDDGGVVHNPMMNDVVLQRMFELSSPAELTNYRRVCPHWRNVARPMWLKKCGFTIVIKDEEDNDTFLNFLDQVQPNEDTIEIKQKTRSWNLTIKLQVYRREHFELFWTKCGVHLTQLTLQNTNIPDVATFQDILFCRHTPNLESLVLDIHIIEGPVVEPVVQQLHNDSIRREQAKLTTLKIDVANLALRAYDFPLDWKSLFITYPNLTHFGIGRILGSVASQTDRIVEAMIEIRSEDRTKLALTSFTMFFNLRDDDDYHEQTLSLPIPASLMSVQFQIRTHAIRLSVRRKMKIVESLTRTPKKPGVTQSAQIQSK